MTARETVPYPGVLVVAFAVVVGAPLLRVLIPSLAWYLRDVELVGTLTLIPYAIAPFALSLLAPLVVLALRVRRSMLGLAVALGGLRLAEQLVTEAQIDLWLSMAGVLVFLLLLTVLVGRERVAVGLGVLLGLTIDTVIRGATGTLDLSWIDDVTADVAAGVLSAVLIGLAWWTGRNPRKVVWPRGRAAVALLFVGPLLFLEWLLLQSQGWVAASTGWSTESALLLITGANAAALWLVVPLALTGVPRVYPLAAGVAVLGFTSVAFELEGVGFAVMTVFGIVGAGVLIVSLLQASPFDDPRYVAPGLWLGAGNVLFLLLALGFYIVLDQDLGIGSRVVLLGAGALAMVAGISGATRGDLDERTSLRPAYAATALLLIPGTLMIGDVVDTPEEGGPIDQAVAMSYNIHSAYNSEGRHDPAEIARVIEASGAHIVGLQEISRSRLLDGGTDLVAWLADELEMPYVAFHGTADPTWGNAIMSRYPIAVVSESLLPRGDTLLQRGFTMVEVDLGTATSLVFVNTHLQHVNDPDDHDVDPEADLAPLHRRQLAPVLAAWGGRQPTVLVGDLNARPGWQQVEEVIAAGFYDPLAGKGEAAYTSGHFGNDGVATWRIDWALLTPDLADAEAWVVKSNASDHYPVVVAFSVP